MSSFKRAEARRSPVRGLRRWQPRCTPLEERCLLSVALNDIAPSAPVVGAPVIWTAGARGHGPKAIYRFSVEMPGGTFQVVRDYSSANSFTWNPLQEGTYAIRVDVKTSFRARRSESAIATYTAGTRVVGDSAVVSPTANPLVALYSAPPSHGSSMYVQFARQDSTLDWQNTAPLPIVPGQSTNFIVAGMLPNTTYVMRHVLDDGTISAPLTFTTGSLPSNVTFPSFSVVKPPGAGIDPNHKTIFHAGVNKGDASWNTANTLATDLNGNVIWYYDPVANDFRGYAQNLEPGGTIMMLGGRAVGVAAGYNTLRQVDLAGNTLRETNINAINARLSALHQPKILDFDHEAKLLPNGDTVVIASTPRVVNYRGRRTKFIGDMVIVLDQNFQPVWVWNAFRWLNTNRLGTDHPVPTDWLHANSVSYSPSDGNLVVSLRTQDWAVKINYANGNGNGRVIWKLGAGGSFTPIASDPQPWFSHQHDVRYINDTTVLVFDDGNTRQASSPNAHSRGQEWILDEKNMTATLVVNADMGNYSNFLGSSQMLPNGNLTFTSGGLQENNFPAGQSIQVLPDGTPVYIQQLTGEFEYRSYFERTLYSAGFLN
jgi:hypothetical protein